MSTELTVGLLAILTTLVGAVSGGVLKLWTWVDKRIVDCEADRDVLRVKIETSSEELRKLSHTVGHMEGRLESIMQRNETIDAARKAQ